MDPEQMTTISHDFALTLCIMTAVLLPILSLERGARRVRSRTYAGLLAHGLRSLPYTSRRAPALSARSTPRG